ncbi:MAG TPA: hypothetical protein VLX60_01040 [Terriglobales bacterium]|nr:hypothetical protein [Terriglobales bacterium]
MSPRKNFIWSVILSIFLATPLLADTVILQSGASFTGSFENAKGTGITFTDNQGVAYTFPLSDVQSLVFTASTDIVTLRNGKVYAGQYTGGDSISFTDNQGVGYVFPVKDVASLVLSRTHPPAPAASLGPAIVIPEGTDIAIHTDETIDSESSSTGQLFSATVAEDVPDSNGNVAIPQGTRAKLVVRNMGTGGAVHSGEIVLDLFSVSVGGKQYRVDTSDVDYSNKRGVGANKRTAEYGGGGAAIGALLGGIFGGGKGAGIGAAAGAGGGLLTQIFTRGKVVKVPSETLLRFRLYRTLVLRPGS